MVEVPSVIYMMDDYAPRVDFFSVGTNDLTQYLLAVDRNNPRVAALSNALHPAVLRALRDIVAAARRHHKPVSVCGEMGGDPAAVLFLLGLGVDSLSMSVSSIPRVKWVVNQFTMSQLQYIAEQVLTLPTSRAVRQFLNERLESNGLGALVRPNPGSVVVANG
jgi:phosphotransferase system enzyme I (PtsP)